jgi:hypothetical protein
LISSADIKRIEDKLDMIINHFNINGSSVIRFDDIRNQAQKDVLKFQEKKRIKRNGIEKT